VRFDKQVNALGTFLSSLLFLLNVYKVE